MVANILPAVAQPNLPRPRGQKVKIKLYQNMVMLHIKLKESRTQQHVGKYFAHIPPTPRPCGSHQKAKI